MRPFTARYLTLAALVPALFVLSVIPGCSNESEGERCGDTNGNVSNNDDCASGLVCTAFPANDGTNETVGRCCYTDHVNDSRCLRNTGVNAVTPGGAGGGSSVGNDADASATDSGTSTAEAGTGGAGAGSN